MDCVFWALGLVQFQIWIQIWDPLCGSFEFGFGWGSLLLGPPITNRVTLSSKILTGMDRCQYLRSFSFYFHLESKHKRGKVNHLKDRHIGYR